MKEMISARRGSALLVVLGLLAFMVMSSVGFAIFMRQSRVPSSHLRRESTARYLLKSALANAIMRLDGRMCEIPSLSGQYAMEGVYDDPYPGLLPDGFQTGTQNSLNGDYWQKRVFTPFGPVDASTTVSTLTLEGLAYLPPALINEARVFSRTTRTAQWTNLAYDLGRYAFTAIDVSDCFDLNKLATDVSRRSSAAGERIVLASLVEQGDQLAEKILSKTNDGEEPLVSLADFNAVMGRTKYTPFMNYIPNGGQFYKADDANSISNALFITDTWFPASDLYLDDTNLKAKRLQEDQGASQTKFDLADKKDQPWKFSGSLNSWLAIPETTFSKVLEQNLGVGLVALYDYLDKDQVPLSLSLPTVEATPMVAGLSVVAPTFALKFEKQDDVDNTYQWDIQGKNLHTVDRKVKAIVYRGLDGSVTVRGTLVYPFKRAKTEKRKNMSFDVETFVAVYFGEDGMPSRLNNKVFRPTKAEWDKGEAFTRDGIYYYFGKKQGVDFGDVEDARAATKDLMITVPPKNLAPRVVAYHVNEEDQNESSDDPLPGNLLDKNIITRNLPAGMTDDDLFIAFNRDGSVANEFKKGNSGKRLATPEERKANPNSTKQDAIDPTTGGVTGSYKPYVAVWVRVVDKSKKTVDLVPASVADDKDLLNSDVSGAESQIANLSGGNYPVMPFTWQMKDEIKFVIDDQLMTRYNALAEFDCGWKSLFCVDPRYNWAPEDWFGTSESEAGAQKWRSLIGAEGPQSQVLGKEGRDRDIFMFTSDQEYLQSIGELAFLPFVNKLGQSGQRNRMTCDFSGSGRYHGKADFASRGLSNLDGFANGTRFWRTYSGYERDNWNMGASNPYIDLATTSGDLIEVVNGESSFCINPLSSDPRVMSAAIDQTPWDYYIASTNDTNYVIDSVEGSPEKYAFAPKSVLDADRWEKRDVADIANELSQELRRSAAVSAAANRGAFDINDAFDGMNWEGSQIGDEQVELFENVALANPLHGVDRKFLYSFWRECFQNRQQLFLVFIRAEPLTVGGAGGDSMSNSQLGARGVALVWRDPNPPPSTTASQSGQGNQSKRKARNQLSTVSALSTQLKTEPPHRTRVLFYHQFD